MFMIDLPFAIDQLERDVLVRGTRVETQDREVRVRAGKHCEGWGLRRVEEVRVEDLEGNSGKVIDQRTLKR